MGLDEDTFYFMLEQFEDLTLMKNLEEMAKAVNDFNYSAMKEAAHSLKGAAGYIGAGRIHWVCYHI